MAQWHNKARRSLRLFLAAPQRTLLLLAVVGLLVFIGAWLARPFTPPAVDLRSLHEDLRARLDPQFPGRGTTDYPGNTDEDVPKGYAMVLKAELLYTGANSSRHGSLAGAAGRFLIAHHDERKDGFPGWGVPVAWDPYGDGSINPAHTKYTISTAIVVDALLDWIQADTTAPRDEVLRIVRGALVPYLAEGILSPSGLLPYSLEPVDRPYDTFNPAGYLAGIMQRYSQLENDPELQGRLRRVADRTVSVHIAEKKMTPSGGWYWHYSISEPIPNDLAHASYIMHGLRMYTEYGGALASQLDVNAVERHLADFISPAGPRIRAWPYFEKNIKTPARSYDLGMGLYLVCSGRAELAPSFIQAVPTYRIASGAYLKYPPKRGEPDLAVREYEAYLLLGMASCLQRPN